MEVYHILGEFGMYREEIVKKLIKTMIPQRLDIGSGFIITSTGKISTQCDLIIYDKNSCPLIENGNLQRFFPIECVVAIGEVKSNLNKQKLKDALLKLKNIALLRNEISPNNSYVFNDENYTEFNPKEHIYDRVMTFLICNEIDGRYESLVNEMDEIYDGCETYLRHNMILVVKDGVFMYRVIPDKKNILYPEMKGVKMINSFIQPSIEKKGGNVGYKYGHIIDFLNYIYMGTASTSILYPEITNYLFTERIRKRIDETYK